MLLFMERDINSAVMRDEGIANRAHSRFFNLPGKSTHDGKEGREAPRGAH
jgi:hypothetical protein